MPHKNLKKHKTPYVGGLNGVDIASLAQAVNTSSDQILAGINSVSQAICGLGNQMGQNTNSILTAIMQGNNALTSQICSCCCDMKQLVTTQGYESQLAMCNQTNALINTANQNTLSLRDGATANTNAILAKLDAIQNQALLASSGKSLSSFFPISSSSKLIF